MENLRPTEKRTDDLPIPITKWTNKQLEEASVYMEERATQSEVVAQSLDAVIAEQRRRNELKKG